MRIDSLYVHIPFCLRKCNYCDFVSFPVSGCGDLYAAYPDLLQRELSLWQEEADLSRLSTVYFGGGTPSLIEPEQARRLLERLPRVSECTLEANPETVDGLRLAAFREAGVDRLSLGAQSFDSGLLAAMGRGHDGEGTARAVRDAREAGFDNISLDLIYGLPEQTIEQWRDSLERAVDLSPEHISLYGLTIHPDTPWGRALAAGDLAAPDDDLAADMLELAMDWLPRQGYLQYEIANFARPGRESRHNCAYWQRDNYLGLGLAASSCLNDHRFANTADPRQYAEAVREGRLPWAEDEHYDLDQIMGEAMFLGLRLLRGVDVADFERRYGVNPLKRFRAELWQLQKQGLVECDESRIRLTRRGVVLGNLVFEQFV